MIPEGVSCPEALLRFINLILLDYWRDSPGYEKRLQVFGVSHADVPQVIKNVFVRKNSVGRDNLINRLLRGFRGQGVGLAETH